MKLLVTGATGFVGQNLVPLLLERGHEVTAVARDRAKAEGFDWHGRVRFVAHDILDATAEVPAAFGEHDAIVHLAWSGLPNYKDLFHFERNLPADYRFLKAVVGTGVKQVLVTGTCLEYGMQSGQLMEDMPAEPTTPYGLAKNTLRAFLEQLVRRQPFVLQWARLFYMHGSGQNPGSLLAQLDRAIAGGQPTFDMSGGEQLRDFLPVGEVAARLAILVEHPEVTGVTNVCSGKPTSVRRLVEERIALRGASIRPNLGHYPYPDWEPMAFWGDARRLDEYLVQER